MREPEIDADDYQIIERQFERCTGKWNGQPDREFARAHWDRNAAGELFCHFDLTKTATRRMLSQIDATRRLTGERPLFV